MLRAAKSDTVRERVDAIAQACRGKLRFALRDHAGLRAEVQRRVSTGDGAREVLDLYPCFTAQAFVPILEGALARPEVAAYAAEIAVRLEQPGSLAGLARELKKRNPACLTESDASRVEVCVWLSYALGPVGAAAGSEAREDVEPIVVALLDAAAPKIREVTVETLAAWGEKGHAAAIDRLIAKEKSGGFDQANDAALLDRFAQRARSLRSGK